jgi:putative DNA primase/helicase
MSKTIRVCELCNAVIPEEWDNEQHYGTCPSCKRGTPFSLVNKELQHIADEENQRKYRKFLLTNYKVFETNERSGIIHINCIGLARLIYKECGFHFRTIEDEDTGKQEIYYYYDGMYHAGGENRIRELVDDFLEDSSSIHHKNEVVDYIKHRNSTKRERLEPPLHLINVRNGIYNFKSGKLEKHTPDFFFLNQIPVEYHKDSKCPQIEKFLSEILYPEYVKVVQEMIGYLMYRDYRFHKAFLLYGGGRNGKTTLINLLRSFIGKPNYSDKELHGLLDNRFSTSGLYGKLANFGSEISGKAIIDTSQFKHLTGGDSIDAEKKFYGSFSFCNYAKLIFNANHIPYTKYDKSLAYFQRWIIIVFPQTFDADDERTDPDIIDKLVTDEELQGLLIFAIEGLRRLLLQKKFSYDDNAEDTVGERYESLMKPEKQFIDNFLKFDYNSEVEISEIYDEYWKWSDLRSYPKLVKKVFSRSMKKYIQDKDTGENCDIKVVKRGGKTVRVYVNVSWKDKPANAHSLDTYSDKKIDGSIPTNIRDAILKIKKNKDAGYTINYDWLKNNFTEGFIKKMLESGLINKLPNDTYEINEAT